MRILVTGGAGFIGSHTCVELIEQGHEVVIFENFSNSTVSVLKGIEQITGKRPDLIQGDLQNLEDVEQAFNRYPFDGVIHFAALKAVGESVEFPLKYYKNNITGTLNLAQCMIENGVNTLIFSSSATVYGEPEIVPVTENESIKPTNPYGQTKSMMEQILLDLNNSRNEFKVALLRYFNPAGAHPSGLIGESPAGIPNNLVPYVAQVASGLRNCVNVFGDNYSTPDGTGVRDYIHVIDLAKAHLDALEFLNAPERNNEPLVVNLGTGEGYSVLQVIKAFEKASGKSIPYTFVDRRPGDIPTCYADCRLATELLGWKARLNLDDMCRDSWTRQLQDTD